jgi:outer membrane protein W
MNKLITIAAILCITTLGFAQDTDQTFKAVSGITTDVSFSPFNAGDQLIKIETLNVRYFMKPNLALRVGLQADYYHDQYDNERSSNSNLVACSHTFLFGILPGIEYHFEGTKRLSPYVGGEVFFYNFSSGAKAESNGDEFYKIKGATDAYESGYENRAFNQFGLSAGAGVDYYFSKHIYIGTEFGYGFSYFRYGKVEEIIDNTTNELTQGKQTEFILGSSVRSTLKLGWKF